MDKLNEKYNILNFFIEDNLIRVYTHKCKYIEKVNAENSIELEVYLAETGTSNLVNNTVESFKKDYIDKHQLLEITSVEKLDISDIEWMDRIPIDRSYDSSNKYIEYLLSIGKDAYEQSLVTTTEDYMTDLYYRLSLIEMGLN